MKTSKERHDNKLDRDEIEARIRSFVDGFRRVGVKVTHQRLEIFRELANSSDHPDPERVFRGVRRRVPTISLDTVYRTLRSLVDLELITVLGSHLRRVRFDANISPHHHFVCRKCGMTRDFYNERYDWLKIPAVVEALGTVEGTHVEARGLCARCVKGKGRQSA
jgi:Fur family transcriptional regulator, peroxide stress response regulator